MRYSLFEAGKEVVAKGLLLIALPIIGSSQNLIEGFQGQPALELAMGRANRRLAESGARLWPWRAACAKTASCAL